MTESWPPWPGRTAAADLARYVRPADVKLLVDRLPSPSGQGPIADLVAVLDRLRAHGVTWVEDPVRLDADGTTGRAGQPIRTPHEVLGYGLQATCVDMALFLAGALVHAGVHPLLGLLTPSVTGPTDHIVMLADTARSFDGRPQPDHPFREPVIEGLPDGLISSIRAATELPGSFLVVDPVAVIDGSTVEAAFARGGPPLSAATNIGLNLDPPIG